MAFLQRNTLIRSLVVLTLVVASLSAWRVKAQSGAANPRTAVETFSDHQQRPAVTAGDRGVTYHWLESRAARVTTKFPDAVAVAERGADGRLRTRLTDLAGSEVASFRVEQVDVMNDVLEFSQPGRDPIRAVRRPNLRPTLDWSNQQVYSLWKDRLGSGSPSLEWQDTLIRPAGATRRDVNRDIVEIHTEWTGGFSSTEFKGAGSRPNIVTGRPTRGDVLISRFRKNDVEVGWSVWYAQEQMFVWSFPGLTVGYIDPSRLKAVGGWPFVPDLAWVSLQNLAFHHFGTLLKERGSIAKQREGWIDRFVHFWTPRLLANEPGCDGLHWLDGSVLRYCCDSHDYCYAKSGCTSSSWWMWWTSWSCDACNLWVVYCFSTGGIGPFQQTP